MHFFLGQIGTTEEDVAIDMAMADNDSVVIVGRRWSNSNFLATKLDRDGQLLWEWEVTHLLSGPSSWRTTKCSEPLNID